MSDFISAAEKVIADVKEDASVKATGVMPLGDNPVVRDEGHADSIVKLLVELEAEKDRIAASAETKIARLDERIKSINYVWFSALRDWAKKRLEETKAKRKSVILDNGVLGFRKIPAKTCTESEMELVKWAEVNLVDAITYRPTVSVTTVAEWETKNGKLAPGRRAVEEEERFNISAPKGAKENE
jgi:hypothetical protein